MPPLRLTLELYNSKVSKQGTLALVFPSDLTDDDVREAIAKVGKVVVAALKREEKRGRFEEKIRGSSSKTGKRARRWRCWKTRRANNRAALHG